MPDPVPKPRPAKRAAPLPAGLAWLETPLESLEWLQAPRVRSLQRFGLHTFEDLLTHFPRRYEDRREFDRFPREESDKPVCICGNVLKTASRRFQGWRFMFDVTPAACGLWAAPAAR